MSTQPSPDAFPHDRVVFFSDAVFAIAITLLVIEIRIPGHGAVAAVGVGGALAQLAPLFIGFVISFLVTALFWSAHLQTWKYVSSVTATMVGLNTLQLLLVALMPFSTGLYAEHVGDNAAFAFYCLNLAGISFFAYLLRVCVIRHERLEQKPGAGEVAWMKQRSLISVVEFLACIPLAYWQPWLGRAGFALIFVMQPRLKQHHRRRMVSA